VVIIDEMESFLSYREAGGNSGLHHVEEVAEFLRRIPEAIKNRVLIIAMTNMIDMIDPAILRRGRFDHIIEVDMPSREEEEYLVKSLLDKYPLAADLEIDKLVDLLTERPLSDTSFVIREAARLAAKAEKTQLDQASIDGAARILLENNDTKKQPVGFVWSK
jgi:SpoVK/Ycf46/Vps4 family AAA+-type ATPase